MSRRILTAEDVAQMEPGSRLVLAEDDTITAPARELARRREIELVEGAPDGAVDVADELPAPEGGPATRAGTIIVVAVGVNRAGVLAELSAAIGEFSGDIQDLSQRITGGYFHAMLVVDVRSSGATFAEFRERLLECGRAGDFVVSVVDSRVFRAIHRI